MAVTQKAKEKIQIIRSGERHHQNFGWLDTRWHFSFAEYNDPANEHWGALRVFNDDVVEAAQGFGMHPHRDMEIITIVLDGALEHQDSLKNRGVIHPGEVQVMSAGKGIVHSEFNHSKTAPLHLLQLWIFPRTRNLTPRWEQRVFDQKSREGRLLPVVSSGDIPETLTIDQDATIYLSNLHSGQKVTHDSKAGRLGYLFVIDGAVELSGQTLAKGDQARLADQRNIEIQGTNDAEFIFLDLPR
ncbi:MAG: pirin family protein [Acidipila sp.]|nr:pirin family protein [Acidipila sp.]